MGMASTFAESAIIVCIPAMVFAASFAQSLCDYLQPQSFKHVLIKCVIGLILSGSIDYIFTYIEIAGMSTD
jgi:hypothetical protein